MRWKMRLILWFPVTSDERFVVPEIVGAGGAGGAGIFLEISYMNYILNYINKKIAHSIEHECECTREQEMNNCNDLCEAPTIPQVA